LTTSKTDITIKKRKKPGTKEKRGRWKDQKNREHSNWVGADRSKEKKKGHEQKREKKKKLRQRTDRTKAKMENIESGTGFYRKKKKGGG